MSYNVFLGGSGQTFKTVASVGVASTPNSVFQVGDNAPTQRENGGDLREGDTWYNESTTTLSVWVINDTYPEGYWQFMASAESYLYQLNDVDIQTTAPTDGQALIWDNARSLWVPGEAGLVDSVNGYNGDVVLTPDDLDDAISAHKFVTEAQRDLIDTAVQPGENISQFANDAGYITAAQDDVQSVNGQTGEVILDADDINDGTTTHKFVTEVQRILIDSATQPGDNVSTLANDANYIDAAGAPIQTVNTQTGDVVLDADDIDDSSTLHKFVTQIQKDLILSSIQPADNISELTNDANYIDAAGAPIQTVNTQTGDVVLDADDISDATTTNKYTTAADITKLAGIETGATADQTGAEIKALYEAEADTNAFTDAEQTKLAGIEAGATADQTDAEIKTAYENNADTNAFTDAEKTKLAGIAAGAEVNVDTDLGNTTTTTSVTVTSSTGTDTTISEASATAAGVMTVAHHDKLDGIEANATADQTGAEIKALYEAEADTNAFTDAEKTKLSGIAAGAEVNVDTDLGNTTTTTSVTVTSSTGTDTTIAEASSTDAGVMSVAHHDKLDGIEAGATADQTDAEIKTAYENNADTNAFTDAEKTKLAGIAAGAEVNTVDSVNGQTGAVVLDKSDVGLSNVDNTSDLNKPVSTATQTALDAKADLVGGLVPTSQLPALAITEYLGAVASQAALLALSGQRGDWAIRTDLGTTWVLTSDGGSQLSDWQELATPTAPVQSVNGQTGTVVLSHTDVGAASAAQGALADSAVQPGDNVSDLVNDANYIDAAGAPVQSVNTQTGAVVLDADDIDDTSTTHKFATAAQLGLADTSLQPGDIGVTVQGYDADTVIDSAYVHTDNNYTSAEKTKLAGIETAATADQTGAEIKALYEAELDTNAFTDAEKTKLAGIAAGAEVNVDTNLGNTTTTTSVTVTSSTGTDTTIAEASSTDAGVMSVAHHDKLDGIETGATADQTDAEIKTAYENNADTNAFTDAEKTKLSGIAAGAEVNVQSDWNESVVSSDAYIQNKPTALSDFTNDLNFIDAAGAPIQSVNTQTGAVVLDADDIDDTSTTHKFATAGQLTLADNSVQPGDNISTLTNDAGYVTTTDGGDAATLDGIDSTQFLRSDVADTKTAGDITFNDSVKSIYGTSGNMSVYHSGSNGYVTNTVGTLFLTASGTGYLYGLVNGNEAAIIARPNLGVSLYYNNLEKFETTSTGVEVTGDITISGTVDGRDVAADGTKLDGIEAGATGDQTAGEILTALLTVDGTGSGLDADLLDGQTGSYYLDYANFTNTPTIPTNNNQLTNGAGYIADITGENLGDLGDVTLSSLTTGDYITWNGSAWVNGVLPAANISGSSIGELADVTITAAATGEVLRYNGTAWVDAVLDYSDLSNAPSALSDLTNDLNFIDAAGAPVQSVNGQTGAVSLASTNLTDAATINADTVDGVHASQFLRSDQTDIMNGDLTVNGDVTFTDTSTDSLAGPEFSLYRNSASPADGDYLGQIRFDGKNDTGGDQLYAKITGKTSDVSNGTEDGLIEYAVVKAGSQTIVQRLTGDALKLINGTGLEVDGNITVNGTVDGRDVAADGTKLDGIAAGAEVNVQSDWNAVSGDALILNKPTNLSDFTNDTNFITSAQAPVQTVNGASGTVVLDADDIDDTSTTHKFVTAAQVSLINSSTQPGDNVSTLTNDAGYLTNITAQSVGSLSDVVITAAASGEVLRYNGTNWVDAQLAYSDLSGTPTNVSSFTNDANYITSAGAPVQTVNSQTGAVVLDADDIDDTSTTHKFATAAQLANADSALQSGDNISELINDAGYLTSVSAQNLDSLSDVVITAAATGEVLRYNGTNWVDAQLAYSDLSGTPTNLSDFTNDTNYITAAGAPVQTVNGASGTVVLDADDIDDTSTTHKFATAAQLANADSALQSGDNVSELTNDANYITSAGAPVQTVNSQTGTVVLDADDIDDTSTAHKFVTAAQVTSIGTAVQPGDNVSDLTNDAGYLTAITAQSIGSLSDVTITAAATGEVLRYNGTAWVDAQLAYSDLSGTPTNLSDFTNDTNYITSAGAPVQSVAGKTGTVTLVKGDVGLGNVDNTSDANKPISTATQAALDDKADLDGSGKVPASQLPSIAITEYLGSVASQAALTALTGQQGDWAIRTDTGSTWVITTGTGSNFSDWVELATPAQAVSSVNSQTGTVVLDADDIDDTATTHKFATAAQLANADSALQSGDNVSTLTNDAGYLTAITSQSVGSLSDVTITSAATGEVLRYNGSAWVDAQLAYSDLSGTPTNVSTFTNDANYITSAGAPVQTVNSQTGTVVLDADDIDDTSTTHKFATAAQLANADSALQSGDNISELTNDSGYLTAITAQSIGSLSDVTITAAATGEVLRYNGSAWVDAQLAYSDLSGTPTNVSTFTNDANYITSAGAPVQTVNSQTGTVVLDADDIDDTSTTHKFVTAAQVGLINTSTQPGDNVSDLTNDAGYLTAITAQSIGSLSDVTITAAATGEVLRYNGSAWVDAVLNYSDLTGAPTTVSSFTNDANYITSAGAPVQSVNGSTGTVVLDADDIDDTSTTHKFATAAQLANADSALQSGDNVSLLTNDAGYLTAITAQSIGSLSDVTITSAATGEVLRYNGSAWVDAQLAYSDLSGTPTNVSTFTNDSGYLTAITAESVGDLSDVTITAAATGEVLRYNGTAWVDAQLNYSDLAGTPTNVSTFTNDAGYLTAITAESIGSLSDVTITGASTGEFLRYNGSAWVDTALVAGDIPDISATYTTVSVFNEADANVDDLVTLSGVAENATNLGTFGGTTIADNETVKGALQDLEDGVEARLPLAGGTLTGDVANTSTGYFDMPSGTTAQRPGSPNSGMLRFNTDTSTFEGHNGSAWGAIGGGVEVSSTAPSSPSVGDLWWDDVSGNMFVYYSDGTSSQWMPSTSTTPGANARANVYIASAPPANPEIGDMWFDDDEGRTYIYYYDGDSNQWVEMNGSGGGGKNLVQIDSVAPTDPGLGQTWYDTTDGRLYIYYYDGDSFQWVDAAPPIPMENIETFPVLP